MLTGRKKEAQKDFAGSWNVFVSEVEKAAKSTYHLFHTFQLAIIKTQTLGQYRYTESYFCFFSPLHAALFPYGLQTERKGNRDMSKGWNGNCALVRSVEPETFRKYEV